MEGQGRRVLHDELLPQLHTALLYLSGGPADHPPVRQPSEVLSAAHRRISRLIREIFALGGSISGLVPPIVEARLREKFANR